ncbi:hypothetical protein D3C72_886160 [compost metagenome]
MRVDERQALGLGLRAQGRDHVLDGQSRVEVRMVDGHLAGLDLGEVQHVVDQRQQVPAVAQHRLEVLPVERIELERLVGRHQIGVADDGVQGRAQLVAHIGQKLALDAVGRLQLDRLGRQVLHLAALRQVARDLGEADQLAVFVVDGRDDDVGPEAGAVFADAPTFVLDVAVARGGGQQPPGAALGQRLGRVEEAVVLPEDLGFGVPLHALDTLVPARNVTLGVEHQDGVVRDVLDQELQLAALILGDLALGQVARDLAVADEGAGLVVDGRDHGQRPEAGAVLAPTPALVLEVAELAGFGQQPARFAGRHVLGQEEELVRLADAFRLGVALEGLGAFVPAGDAAVRRQHDDRVVRHALHQQAKPLLAVHERLVGGIALGGAGLELVLGRGGVSHQRGSLPRRHPIHGAGRQRKRPSVKYVQMHTASTYT